MEDLLPIYVPYHKLNKKQLQRLEKIHNKMFNFLSLEEILFLRKISKKYWYHYLYYILWFDNFYVKGS